MDLLRPALCPAPADSLGHPCEHHLPDPDDIRAEGAVEHAGQVVAGVCDRLRVAILVYRLVNRELESRFRRTTEAPASAWWVVAQWCSTGFLWSQWLVQDLANIFVFLPRDLPWGWFWMAVVVMLALYAIIFYTHGGAIQKVVLTKTNTTDIRSATFVDLIYGIMLFLFKEVSHIPMSTTWVFVGLLAGREIAIAWNERHRSRQEVSRLLLSDFAKITAGLLVSVALAYLLPVLQEELGR